MQFMQKTVHSMLHAHAFGFGVFVALISFVFFAGGLVVANGQTLGPNDSHVVSLYVDGEEQIVPTRAQTIEELLNSAGVTLSKNDLVEPSLKAEIDSDNFSVQVYRARPVTIIEGTKQQRIMTPHRDERTIAEAAGYKTFSEDSVKFEATTSFVRDQTVGHKLVIDRAVPVTVSLYGSPPVTYRTQVETVGDLLQEKNIVPEAGATIIPLTSTPITPNMVIFIAKPGKVVTLVEEQVPFPIESTPDPTKPNSVVTITKPGVVGKKQVVYEIIMRGGKEVGRKKIQEVIAEPPQKQLQTRGTKPGAGLSKSKGAHIFIDSKGVPHRETYYDLPMSSVMGSCGAGGFYTVRSSDGAKVDKDGYVIIAANFRNYPKCSVVETSIGPGKVYDTGGFALVHPYGFDLATDWSNNNGR